MKLSKQWLEQFVDIPDIVTAEQLAHDITMHTVEVEEAADQGGLLRHIVVGLVKEIHKHPNADKLHVCIVSDGHDDFRVVCGGSNLREGMKIAFGKIGAQVRWHGQGELITLEKAVIRGEESHGMICASDEIGLGDRFSKQSEKEILDLSDLNVSIGTPLAEAVGVNDVIIDIENKTMTHRPDLWGHYGIAREVAAIYRMPLKPYDPEKIPALKRPQMTLSVTVEEPRECPRYMGLIIDGVTVAPSPVWMQQHLEAVGVRPINNIVDITNYVMFELGQPMHAFDADHIDKQTICVRKARAGEKITALDNKEYTLNPEMLVIADTQAPVAIAGVIGGEHSGVSDTTTRIIFEAANFNPISVRKTATALGIRTDSSTRFEKSLDPTLPEIALRRAVELTLELCPDAHVVSEVVDQINPQHFRLHTDAIELSHDFICRRIGVDIPADVVIDILTRLGFGVKEKKGALTVHVPTWRATKDISIPEDIVEEVARMHGYAKIPVTLPRAAIDPPANNPLRELERVVKRTLAFECGYTEVYNHSFESPVWLENIGVDYSNYLQLNNPIAKDKPLVRRNLISNLLANMEKNAHRFDEIQLFEVGQTYVIEQPGEAEQPESNSTLPKQDVYLGCVVAKKEVATPFFEISRAVESVFSRLHLGYTMQKQQAPDAPFLHPGRYAWILVDGQEVGRVAELHPEKQEALGIPYRTAFVQLNLSTLASLRKQAQATYQPLPIYPGVERDIAFVVDQPQEHATIVRMITQIDPLIQSVTLFDVFEGEKIPAGKKNMAYHLVYQSNERTLTTDEVDEVHTRVTQMLSREVGAQIRAE